MTLNTKIGVLLMFTRFWAARHISRANCAKIIRDRPGRAAYENFSIERRFQRFKSRPSRFKETCTRGHQKAVPLKVVISLPLASLAWKQLQTGTDMLSITTRTSDELFSHINIDDPEKPWTRKEGVFIFCDFRLRRTLQEWIATKCLKIE